MITHQYWIRTNAELEERYSQSDMETTIKSEILRWVAHVNQMDNKRFTNIVQNEVPDGKSLLGRLRMGCNNLINKKNDESTQVKGNCGVSSDPPCVVWFGKKDKKIL